MTNELKRYYSDLRDKNLRLHQKRLAECEAKNARFRALEDEPGRVFQQLAAGKLTSAAAISRIGQISAERRNLLISMGLKSDYLDMIYTCPICKDSYTEAIPRLPHDYQDGVCTGCGQILRTVTISCDPGASVTVYVGLTVNSKETTVSHPASPGRTICCASCSAPLRPPFR